MLYSLLGGGPDTATNLSHGARAGRRTLRSLRPLPLSGDFNSEMQRFVSNASHMKVAQKPRGTARFGRNELVSVCGIWQWRRHSCLLSQRAIFGVSFLLCALDPMFAE